MTGTKKKSNFRKKWYSPPSFSVWILSKMFGFFIIRKLFDISCISDHVQPVSKPLSVVLAECGHFVVT